MAMSQAARPWSGACRIRRTHRRTEAPSQARARPFAATRRRLALRLVPKGKHPPP